MREVERLREECALKTQVDAQLHGWRIERDVMSSAFKASHEELVKREEDLQTMIEGAREEMGKHYEEFKSVSIELGAHTGKISTLSEMHQKAREEITDERRRAESISSQQQHNRKELNYLTQRAQDLDKAVVEGRELRQTQQDMRAQVASLEQQVGQWKDAIAAQQELRGSSTKLRFDVDVLQKSLDKVMSEQQRLTAGVSTMTGEWLAAGATRAHGNAPELR